MEASSSRGVEAQVENGRAIVRLAPSVTRFRFTGESDPSRHPVAAQLSVAELTIDGHVLEARR